MWNEEHAFEISSEKEAMIEVFDKENVGQDKFMGELKVCLSTMVLLPRAAVSTVVGAWCAVSVCSCIRVRVGSSG